MNIFFYHDEKNHSSLMGDLAWSNHKDRIKQLQECKLLIQRMIEEKNITDNSRISFKRGIRYYDKLIQICHKYKEQPAVTEEWFLNYVKQKKKRSNNGQI
jgi:hypothetical protein